MGSSIVLSHWGGGTGLEGGDGLVQDPELFGLLRGAAAAAAAESAKEQQERGQYQVRIFNLKSTAPCPRFPAHLLFAGLGLGGRLVHALLPELGGGVGEATDQGAPLVALSGTRREVAVRSRRRGGGGGVTAAEAAAKAAAPLFHHGEPQLAGGPVQQQQTWARLAGRS